MRAKRAAMLADNAINVPVEDEEEVEELENDDGESTDTSEDSVSERLSVVEPEQVSRGDWLVNVRTCVCIVGGFTDRSRDEEFQM